MAELVAHRATVLLAVRAAVLLLVRERLEEMAVLMAETEHQRQAFLVEQGKGLLLTNLETHL